jgi:hypothetical protein
MEGVIVMGLNAWVAEARSKTKSVRETALYDLQCAARCPSTVPLLAMAARATGFEPGEVLERLLMQVEEKTERKRRRTYANQLNGRNASSKVA